MIDEDGVDVGRTIGDLMEEVKQALIRLYGVSSPTKIEGEGWTVYRTGSSLRASVLDEAWRP